MMIVPLQAISSQGPIQVMLGGQAATLNVYTKRNATFMDVSVGTISIQQGKQCRDRVLIVRHAYLGFLGDLVFIDTQGLTDPIYTGFGADPSARYLLVYLAPSELPGGLH